MKKNCFGDEITFQDNKASYHKGDSSFSSGKTDKINDMASK